MNRKGENQEAAQNDLGTLTVFDPLKPVICSSQ